MYAPGATESERDLYAIERCEKVNREAKKRPDMTGSYYYYCAEMRSAGFLEFREMYGFKDANEVVRIAIKRFTAWSEKKAKIKSNVEIEPSERNGLTKNLLLIVCKRALLII